jgi:sugar lactone lactonase YvrE
MREVEPDLPGHRRNGGEAGPDGAFRVGTMKAGIAGDGSRADVMEETGG